MIEFTYFYSPIGVLSMLAVKEGIIKISFQSDSRKDIDKWCRNKLSSVFSKGNQYTSDAKSKILSYLSGKIQILDFPVVHINSPFRMKVLDIQRKIPYGQTRSYKEVADMAGRPRAYRAVGSANAHNPLPLYFPCHRIICSDGRIGGFGGGSKVKIFLLELEKNNFL